MKSILLSAALGLSLASTALAGSPALAPQQATATLPPEAGQDWAGFYAGALVSFDSGDVQAYNNGTPTTFATLEPTTGFGGFVGYNKQVNALVFGGELAYTAGDVVATGFPSSFYTDRIDLKARAGYSFGRVLAYAVVGYSFADFEDESTNFPSSGMNYGVGVDVMINNRLFVGAEYLMRDLSGDNSSFTIDGNLNSAIIRAGLKF